MEKTVGSLMKKVVITGPESSGKTTLFNAIEEKFGIAGVPEFARVYIDQLDRPYVQGDLIEIANGQLQLEQKFSNENKDLLLCDTDLLTIKVWSEYKYGICDPIILNQLMHHLPDYYVLASPDIPWEPDPQRENSKERDELFQIYQKEILTLKIPSIIVAGSQEQRMDKFLKFMNDLL
tara:strand:- start:242 stop:775 length:534 start_codon:yes stop_codon:yes gene_type:complete